MDKVKTWLKSHEGWISGVLIVMAILLVWVAIFGKVEHKVGLMVYVLFP